MKKMFAVFLTSLISLVGFVVAFVRTYVLQVERIDHSGLHTYIAEKTSTVAFGAKRWMYSWLSRLQHSPTAMAL